MTLLSEESVRIAATALVEAFAATDTEAYFACFEPAATFCFHSEPHRLENRGAYRELWEGWVAGGWRVVSCESTEQRIQIHGDAAIFTHSVRTTVVPETGAAEDSYAERETIVFTARDGALLAVHEHLSAPTAGAAS